MKRLLIYSLCAIVTFSVVLGLLVASLGRVDGQLKTSPGTPTALVSIGAPRSQLELKRMFSRMSASYFEGDRRVYEPITLSHRETVAAKVESGESVGLSVEEVIYIISNSVAVYSEYDVINLVGRNGEADERIYPERELINGYESYHVTAAERINDITAIIVYRLMALSSADRIKFTENGCEYIPVNRSREESERVFIIDLTDGKLSERIVFCPDSGRHVEVFPYSSLKNDADSKILKESSRRATEVEAELIRQGGYDPDECRNITPRHWYERTDLRLFVSGGLVIIVDPASKRVIDTLPRGQKFTSVAICGDYDPSVYFTSSDSDGSALWRYSEGKITEIYRSDAEYLGIYESYDGEYVELYETVKSENGKYMTLLIRKGNCLWASRMR